MVPIDLVEVMVEDGDIDEEAGFRDMAINKNRKETLAINI